MHVSHKILKPCIKQNLDDASKHHYAWVKINSHLTFSE